METAGALYVFGVMFLAIGLGVAFKSPVAAFLVAGVGAIAAAIVAFVLAKDKERRG